MLDRMFNSLPTVIKNLLIINVLVYVAQFAVPIFNEMGGLYPIQSENFQPWQFVTYFFMHSTYDFGHLFFNMFGLLIFGVSLERSWGSKRFLQFYVLSAIGGAIVHSIYNYVIISGMMADLPAEVVEVVLRDGTALINEGRNYTDAAVGALNLQINTPMVGASGAIFGVSVAFAYLFPNTELLVFPIPFPIKAKYLVGIYVLLEIYRGFGMFPHDNVAHFAHLGGALVGFLLLLYWQKNKDTFY